MSRASLRLYVAERVYDILVLSLRPKLQQLQGNVALNQGNFEVDNAFGASELLASRLAYSKQQANTPAAACREFYIKFSSRNFECCVTVKRSQFSGEGDENFVAQERL